MARSAVIGVSGGSAHLLGESSGESPGYQRNAVAVLADVLPNAESATLEGQGHQFSPAVLAAVVEKFFAIRPSKSPGPDRKTG